MIGKLGEADRAEVLEYLSKEPAYNVFAIGDIENFGFGADFQDVWGDRAADGGFRAVLLRYFQNHVLYSASGPFDEDEIAGILSRAPQDAMLSGREDLVRAMAGRSGFGEVKSQFLLNLPEGSQACRSRDQGVEWAGRKDFDEVLALQAGIEEFRASRVSNEGILHNFETGTGRTAILRSGGTIVSCASSAAENSKSAMLIGVCTAKDQRNRGLATRCIAALCGALQAEGKTPCLFFHNPAAGRIYRRIGFQDAGRWAMATRKPQA